MTQQLKSKIFLDASFKYKEILEQKSVDGTTVEEPAILIEGYASTNSVDRARDVIVPSAWMKSDGLVNYEKNPIVLFNHDYDSPIGKVIDIAVDSKGLYIKASISSANDEVYKLIKEGILKTFSVGFIPKEYDYNQATESWAILDVELLEISVVSVPCNQDALFELSKSFASSEEYERFKSQFINKEGVKVNTVRQEKVKMDPQEIEQIRLDAQEAARKAYSEEVARIKAEEKAAKEAEEKAAALEAKITADVTAKVTATAAEKVIAEVEKRLEDNSGAGVKLSDLQEQIMSTQEQIKSILSSKERFPASGSEAKSWETKFEKDAEAATLLGIVTKKGIEGTKFGTDLIQKVNNYSSAQVSSATFETIANTSIERDIWLDLILAPMFPEITMTSATQVVPWIGDAGYAEISNAAGSTNATAPNGTIDERGKTDRGGIVLGEISFKTDKFVTKSYLADETEEDSIMPVLPLIRENMIRAHARGIENLLLLGGHADGQYTTTTGSKGLLKYVDANSTAVNGPSVASGKVTAANLQSLRRKMGKYGIRPNDVVYVVSMDVYFDLLEDPEYQDYNLVNNLATKLTGEVGKIYGSPVVVCDEFPTKAAGKYGALALNKRNFAIPRLRGLRLEEDRSIENQYRVLVATQRLGFSELIPGAASVAGLKYTA